jgi:hypothetical protein
VAVNESTNVGNFSVFNRCTEVCQGETNGSLDFDPVSVVLVTHHVHLSGGTGGASLSEFGATLDRCPSVCRGQMFISVPIWFSIMRRSLDVRGNVLNCAAINPGRPRASGSNRRSGRPESSRSRRSS